MRLALILLALVLASCSRHPAAADKPQALAQRTASCQMAAEYLHQHIDKSAGVLILGQSPSAALRQISSREQWKTPYVPDNPAVSRVPGPTPPRALRKALEANDGVSVTAACPNVRALLDQRHAIYGAEVEKLRSRSLVEHMSLPAVSADGREAVFAWRWVAGMESGSSDLLYVRKNGAGVWEVVSKLGLMMI